jgi:predicted ribosome-associated RNA-binding protein Tma20
MFQVLNQPKHFIIFSSNSKRTLLQIEDTINETARYYHQEKQENCIVIYDRGAMDPIACKSIFSDFEPFNAGY